MRQRCFNPRGESFKDYGGRGIQVCAQWDTHFEIYHKDMETTWFPGASIHRVNNDGHYNLQNCKWENPTEQSRNRRGVKLTLEIANQMRLDATLGELPSFLAKRYGVSKSTAQRILSGKIYAQ